MAHREKNSFWNWAITFFSFCFMSWNWLYCFLFVCLILLEIFLLINCTLPLSACWTTKVIWSKSNLAAAVACLSTRKASDIFFSLRGTFDDRHCTNWSQFWLHAGNEFDFNELPRPGMFEWIVIRVCMHNISRTEASRTSWQPRKK